MFFYEISRKLMKKAFYLDIPLLTGLSKIFIEKSQNMDLCPWKHNLIAT